MLIHSRTLTPTDILGAVPEGCFLAPFDHPGFGVTRVGISGSKSHGRKFNVLMSGNAKHGNIWSERLVDPERGATWDEWGNFIAALFKLDPGARVGIYKTLADFVQTTADERDRYRKHMSEADAAQHSAPWLDDPEIRTLYCEHVGNGDVFNDCAAAAV